MDCAFRTFCLSASVRCPCSCSDLRIACLRWSSSASCCSLSRMAVMFTSSRLPVASLRYRAIKGTVAPSSSRDAVAFTRTASSCSWVAMAVIWASFIGVFPLQMLKKVNCSYRWEHAQSQDKLPAAGWKAGRLNLFDLQTSSFSSVTAYF